MAVTVREIMNRELFSVRPQHTVSDVLNGILALGITGAPVCDEDGRPLGMVSLRDLVSRSGATAGDLMSRPAATVAADATIPDAARVLAETGFHRLVAVDLAGRAVGVVSALDFVRAMLGLPAAHPPAFPHLDQETQLTWTDDQPLDFEHIDPTATGPGLIVLVHGGRSLPERVVWAESTEDVACRLTEMLSTPQAEEPVVAWWLGRGGLRFRTALTSDRDKRARVLPRLLSEARLTATPY